MSARKLPARVVRQELHVARCTGRLNDAVPFGLQLIELEPDRAVPNLRLVADLLRACGRHDEALLCWKRLADAAPTDLEAQFQIQAAERGRGFQGARAKGINDTIQSRINRLLREQRIADPPNAHHVAIGGVSYCGSTLLERILGACPGIASIGESHWLIRRRSSFGNSLLDFSQDPPEGMIGCGTCGFDCPVWTVDFRAAILSDRSNWYNKIAQRLGTHHLISSDKNPAKLLEQDPHLSFDLLILYKSPEAAWESQRKHLLERGRDVGREMRDAYLKKWAWSYKSLLDLKVQGRKVVMSFEAFTKSPERGLELICQSFELPHVPISALRERTGHSLGGNTGVNKAQQSDEGLVVKPLRAAQLSMEDVAAMYSSSLVREVAANLNRTAMVICR